MKIAGLERDLPLCPINDQLSIGAFIMFSDVELTIHCAKELVKKCPPADILITAESKGIPLAYEMARQLGINYVVARKSIKLYMTHPVKAKVKSITTAQEQTLYLAESDVEKLKGKRVLIVDDVISTGESLRTLEYLIHGIEGIQLAGKATVLAEGQAADRTDIIYLEKLPLFSHDGTVIE